MYFFIKNTHLVPEMDEVGIFVLTFTKTHRFYKGSLVYRSATNSLRATILMHSALL